MGATLCKCGAVHESLSLGRGQCARASLESSVDVASRHLLRQIPPAAALCRDANTGNLAGRSDVDERRYTLRLPTRIDHEHPDTLTGPLLLERIAAAARRRVEGE